MRRRPVAVAGSLAVHAMLALALLSSSSGTRSGRPRSAATIELVESSPIDVVMLAPPTPPATRAGGGRSAPTRIATRATRVRHDPDGSLADVDPRGALTIEARSETGQGGGGGEGTGRGGGRGTGIGFGDGGGISTTAPPPPPPPPPRAAPLSKARPARLIYPARERQVDDAELFVARVIVDAEGYVVGAKLERGFGVHRDAQAAELIWKFRYAPALDATGRPIRSIVHQKFLVQ